MPPKAKFTKEEVARAALGIWRERGKSALTARELGAKLGASARPIFTLFAGMDEVIAAAERAARDVYNAYVSEGLREQIAFRGVGRAYIRFAREEASLFRILFMERHCEDIKEILPVIDENYGAILQSIISAYGVSGSAAEKLYRHLWVYSHGIASLIATGSCELSEEETDKMLTDVFVALLIKTKGEEK